MGRQLPFLANELLERIIAAGFNLALLNPTSSELIPRKNRGVLQQYWGFLRASHAFRRIALQAWFSVFVPARVEEFEDDHPLMVKYNLNCFVKHLFLSAVFELRSPASLDKFRNLESLSYFADPHLHFISFIPPTVRALELRGSAHPRVQLLAEIGRKLDQLVFLRITNNVESMGLRESTDIESLQEEYSDALSPMKKLEYLSLNVNLGKVPRQPYAPDGRPDNENSLALLIAKLLPNLRGMELHWETCIGTGAGEKSVFWVRSRGQDGIVGLRKLFMSKASEDSPWGFWLMASTPEAKSHKPTSGWRFWFFQGSGRCPRERYLGKGAKAVTEDIKG